MAVVQAIEGHAGFGIRSVQATPPSLEPLRGGLQKDLEAVRYAARSAEKQYDARDPEYRLVSEELERRWNQALERASELELRMEQEYRLLNPQAG